VLHFALAALLGPPALVPYLPEVVRPVAAREFGLDVSPDGATAITAFTSFEDRKHSAKVRVWDVAAGVVLTDLPLASADTITDLRFTPSGKSLVVALRGYSTPLALYHIDLKTGRELRRIPNLWGTVEVAEFSPDGLSVRVKTNAAPLVAKGKDRPGPLRLMTFHLETGEKLSDEPWEGLEHPSPLARTPNGKVSVGYHPDGKSRWGYDPKTGLYLIRDGAAAVVLPESKGADYTKLALSADGKVLVGRRREGAVEVIDVSTGKVLRPLAPDPQTVTVTAFADGGRLLFTAMYHWGWKQPRGGSRVCVWDLAAGELRQAVAFQETVLGVSPTPDGKRAVVLIADESGWRGFALIDAVTGKTIRTVPNPGKLHGAQASWGGKWVAASAPTADKKDVTVTLWNAQTGDVVRTFPLNSGTEHPWVSFRGEEAQLVTHGLKGTTLWDAASGKKVKEWQRDPKVDPERDTKTYWWMGIPHPTLPVGYTVAPTGNRRQSYNLSRTSETESKRVLHLWDHMSHPTVSADGKWITVYGGESPGYEVLVAPLDETGTPGEWRRWKGSEYRISSVAFSPDAKTLAIGGGDHVVRLWDVATNRVRATLYVPPAVGPATDWLAFTPEGYFAGSERGRTFLRFREVSARLPPTAETRPSSAAAKWHLPDKVRAAVGGK
jgi:WD40 repeat protein